MFRSTLHCQFLRMSMTLLAFPLCYGLHMIITNLIMNGRVCFLVKPLSVYKELLTVKF